MKYYLYLWRRLYTLLHQNPRLLISKLSYQLKQLKYKTLSWSQFVNSLDNVTLQQPFTLVFNTILSGGANTYLHDYLNKLSGVIIIIQSRNLSKSALVKVYNLPNNVEQIFRVKLTLANLATLNYKEVIINHLLFMHNTSVAVTDLLELVSSVKSPLTIMINDYYYLCPSVNLLDYNNKFCNLPDAATCNNCLNSFVPQSYAYDYIQLHAISDIKKWRNKFYALLDYATKIVVPSVYTADLFCGVYKEFYAKTVAITPSVQPISFHAKNTANATQDTTINIAILGKIDAHKGAYIVYELAQLAITQQLPIRFIVIGNIIPYKRLSNLQVTGQYTQAQLPKLVADYKIHAFIIPSICPETYSYTTEESLSFNLPVLVFNIGAHAPRVASYKYGHVIDKISAVDMLQKIMTLYSAVMV